MSCLNYAFFSGMSAFLLVWAGQLVSLIGSELSSFALRIWVYQSHQGIMEFALISIFALLPEILMAPLAGVLTDRWNRRWVMILSDTGAAVATVGIALLLLRGNLEVWHIYVAIGISSAFAAFHWPAYTAATTLLVPGQYLGRASGLVQLGLASSRLISPTLAGVLIGLVQLPGIILIDLSSFFFALLTLALVKVPDVPTQEMPEFQSGNFWGEILEGWLYIKKSPGLLGLLIFSAADNFLVGLVGVLVMPFALSFATPSLVGLSMSIGGVGMVIGSLVMASWGIKRSYIDGVLIFNILSGLAIFSVGWHTSITLLSLCSFLFFFSFPIVNGCSQVIWQKKVALEIQGRVFALQKMVSFLALPIAYLSSGFLVDKIFEPLMAHDGLLANNLGLILGTGPGRGVGLFFILVGCTSLIITTVAFCNHSIRYVEKE